MIVNDLHFSVLLAPPAESWVFHHTFIPRSQLYVSDRGIMRPTIVDLGSGEDTSESEEETPECPIEVTSQHFASNHPVAEETRQ